MIHRGVSTEEIYPGTGRIGERSLASALPWAILSLFVAKSESTGQCALLIQQRQHF